MNLKLPLSPVVPSGHVGWAKSLSMNLINNRALKEGYSCLVIGLSLKQLEPIIENRHEISAQRDQPE